jgi:methylmalonyl-CoA mutase N-terminal domain/subunit
LTEPNGSKGKSGWLEGRYAKTVEKSPERDYPFETSDGHKTEPLYGPEDLNGWDYEKQLGFPGEFPYTRGVQPTMYRGRLWTMRQYAGFGDAEESNERYRYLLGQGQTGLSVAFDLPTQIGYDSDHAMAAGEVGKVGVAISSLADMELLMKEIPLEKVTTSMTINATAAILLAFYVALRKRARTCEAQRRPERHPQGTSPAGHIYPPEGSMR